MDSGDEEEENQEEPEVGGAMWPPEPQFAQISREVLLFVASIFEHILFFLCCRRKPNLTKAEEAPRLLN